LGIAGAITVAISQQPPAPTGPRDLVTEHLQEASGYTPGKRFTGPIEIWVVGPSLTLLRDGAQRKLLGRGATGELGAGFLPCPQVRQPVSFLVCSRSVSLDT